MKDKDKVETYPTLLQFILGTYGDQIPKLLEFKELKQCSFDRPFLFFFDH